MPEFETLINPPQEVFEEIITLSGESDNWSVQLGDYEYRTKVYDQYWLFVTVEKESNDVVSSITLARWDAEDGPLYSIGLYYCAPRYRGHGHARPIFKRVMDIIGNNNAFLAGNYKMTEKYAMDYGFDKTPNHWHMCSTIKCADVRIPDTVSENYETKKWSDVNCIRLTEYDRSICDRERRKIMTSWMVMRNTFGRIVFDISSGKIVGYGVFRIVTRNKLSPAPFYADNLEAAEVLLKDILNMIPQWQSYASFSLMYAECNQDALRLLEHFAKDKDSISTCRLYRSQFTKKFIETPSEKVYAPVECAHQFV
ncbi:hypothetical protein L5515_006704 [Caenorhabditis briggsae]|uniref:N-acetyltransferase domain-containing protein n=1 Tax=Caenorhabditis briggsae TaxID=6238 RepID=A0AAE9F266_CAEBR|nr:hypothetical protein L5515_006704 [Caenorhabditis briggsae]